MTNDETETNTACLPFVIRTSSFIRHSGFVIRHSPTTPLNGPSNSCASSNNQTLGNGTTQYVAVARLSSKLKSTVFPSVPQPDDPNQYNPGRYNRIACDVSSIPTTDCEHVTNTCVSPTRVTLKIRGPISGGGVGDPDDFFPTRRDRNAKGRLTNMMNLVEMPDETTVRRAAEVTR